MLWLERRVGDVLVQEPDPQRRAAIASYVDEALKVMPELLRAGLAGESLVLGALPAVRSALGRLDPQQLAGQVGRWEHSRVGPIRQYVRALHSLVLFAEQELATGDGLAASAPAGVTVAR